MTTKENFGEQVRSLHGIWAFAMNPEGVGGGDSGLPGAFTDTIELPGTTDKHKKGPENPERERRTLTRTHPHVGPAFYRKEVSIPEVWAGKRVFLHMERTKTSTVWVGERRVGERITLITPHRYDLTDELTPGRHTLTVRIDNSDIPPGAEHCHQMSESTQTNWNGILGAIDLVAKDPCFIEDVQAYCDLEPRRVRLRLTMSRACSGTLILGASAENTDTPHELAWSREASTDADGTMEMDLDPGPDAQTWDEFHPALYRFRVTFAGDSGSDTREFRIGMRDFSTRGTQFAVNGRTTFLRGKHDACVFPLTGYAPMDAEEWKRVLRIAKSYGINHYRFHGWCPPNAAFEAADEVGMYLQPELPFWSAIGGYAVNLAGDVEVRGEDNPEMEDAIRHLLGEGYRLLKEYGNHPSFCMLALGNELRGDIDAMASIVRRFRGEDPRHLYAHGSNNFLWEPVPGPADDYWTTGMTGGNYKFGEFNPNCRGHEVRGSYCVHTQGHVNNAYPGTRKTYAGALEGVDLPVVGHEVGQYQVFPNFDEIEKYTGVLRARNLEAFREDVERAGLLPLARDFFRASGALSVLCYREDIEAALRTPGFGGFQLLDLQDFPGQGTALVGILDAFMDSKGLITPEAWREFCNDVVPLAEFDKYTWTTEEAFRADLRLANYGPRDLSGETISWALKRADGEVLASGQNAAEGSGANPMPFGSVDIPLDGLTGPQKLELALWMEGTGHRNAYPLWVYGAEPEPKAASGTDVWVTRSLDEDAISALESGGRVLLCPDGDSVEVSVPGAFQPDFWCYPMFKKYNPPGTLGILCDPEHAALKGFPTEFHANWQWWPLLKHGCAMILDDFPHDLEPIIRVIDNFERNHRLANLFECRVKEGRLLVCSCDLLNQQMHPEGRQLLASLSDYAASDAFRPSVEVSVESLFNLLGN